MTRFSFHNSIAYLALASLFAAGCASPCPWGQCGPDAYPANVPTIQIPQTQPANAAPAGAVIRGQSPGYEPAYGATPPAGDQYPRGPMPISGGAITPVYPQTGQPTYNYQPPPGTALPPPPAEAMPPATGPSGTPFAPTMPWWQPPSNIAPTPEELGATPTPLDIFVEETRTGRFMFGVAVNSDAGVTGQITLDERNFDIMRPPVSWDDFLNGTAWRGAGQGFRLEAQPGSQVQRYLISFTEPYFLNSNVSFNTSAFYFDRNYFDYDESRYGGRLAWGYRLTPDLSVSTALRAEDISIFDPRVIGLPELDNAVGDHELYSGRFTLTHDTRDLPFMPTEGHLIELAYEQVFGSFDYPRGEIDYSQYWLLRERPDGSGRHTLGFSTRLGFTGSDTPLFENYFAGGYSTLRGFSFRGASPIESGVRVGGEFRWLNSVEYFFPLTADDMIKGIVFCDFGTVEEKIELRSESFRVAPGIGLRINVPALGPAPLAFDFAFPVSNAAGDDEQTFSFFFGAMR